MDSSMTVSEDYVAGCIKPRAVDSRKGENGCVAVVGGGSMYHGAPFLAASASLRSGVDLVYIVAPRVMSIPLRSLSPNFIIIPYPDSKLTVGCANRIIKWLPKVDSMVIGPGLGKQRMDGVKTLLKEMLSRGVRLLLDADALALEVISECKGKDVVITPHAGEFRRLFNVELSSNVEERSKHVKERAEEYGVVILLKGPVDIISDGGRVLLNKTGTPAMTVGGSGDVLSGLVAGIMAKGVPPFDAASAGAYLNGLAGEHVADRIGLHMTATDLIEAIPTVMKKFDRIIQ